MMSLNLKHLKKFSNIGSSRPKIIPTVLPLFTLSAIKQTCLCRFNNQKYSRWLIALASDHISFQLNLVKASKKCSSRFHKNLLPNKNLNLRKKRKARRRKSKSLDYKWSYKKKSKSRINLKVETAAKVAESFFVFIIHSLIKKYFLNIFKVSLCYSNVGLLRISYLRRFVLGVSKNEK
jgi:hypothetical protein